MKKLIYLILIAAVFTACGKKSNKEMLVGKWTTTDIKLAGDQTMKDFDKYKDRLKNIVEFKTDGTFNWSLCGENNTSKTGTFKITDKDGKEDESGSFVLVSQANSNGDKKEEKFFEIVSVDKNEFIAKNLLEELSRALNGNVPIYTYKREE